MSIENTIKNLLEESRKFKGQPEDLDENAATKNAVAADAKKKLDAKNSPSDGSGENEENKKNNKGTQKSAEGGTSKKANAATKGADSPEGRKSLDAKNSPSNGSGMNPDNARNIKIEAKEDDDVKDVEDDDEDKKDKEDDNIEEGKFKELDIEKQEKEEKEKKKKEKNESEYDMTEDVDALFNGEEGMTEEFRQKAETIFESAVVARIKEEVERIEEEYNQKLEEQYEQIAESLVDNIDGYLNLMIEQWMEDNAVAIEAGLKNDIMESFVGGMKTLFEQHYIDVPEEKYDLVGELENKIEDLSAKLDETFELNVRLRNELNEKARVEIVNDICEGLSDVEAEKLQALAEEINFDNSDTFTKKIQTIRENYFSKKTDKKIVNNFLTEDTIEEEKQVSANMSPYVNALAQLNRK